MFLLLNAARLPAEERVSRVHDGGWVARGYGARFKGPAPVFFSPLVSPKIDDTGSEGEERGGTGGGAEPGGRQLQGGDGFIHLHQQLLNANVGRNASQQTWAKMTLNVPS